MDALHEDVTKFIKHIEICYNGLKKLIQYKFKYFKFFNTITVKYFITAFHNMTDLVQPTLINQDNMFGYDNTF